jgi:large subunit ribosomal protein L9
MFERDNAGFTEAYDPNAEPGTIAEGGNEEEGQADPA